MMGIFSNLIDKVAKIPIVNKVFQPGGIADKITSPIQYFGAIVANPGTTITQGPNAALQKAKDESFEKQAGKVLLNTGTVAAAVLTGGTTAGRTAATTIGKSLIPKTAKQVLVTAAVVPVAAGVLSQTKKPLDIVTKAPSALLEFGKDAGKLIEDPSLKNAEKLLKENPGVSIALGGAGLIIGGKSLLPAAGAVTNIQTKEAVQDLTNQLSNIPTAGAIVGEDTSKELTTTQKPFSPTTAITPATQIQKPTTQSMGVRRQKRKSTRSPVAVNQRVNILVQNKNSSIGTKNYLKREILV